MKSKTLLIAAATLAAGVMSSQAGVYSQNIVGYVNNVVPAGTYVLCANPLTTGNDVLTNVLKGVAGGTQLSYWNGSGWNTYTYSGVTGKFTYSGADVSNTNLPPGVGFFLYNSTKSFTNTYTGTIDCNSGNTCTNPIVLGYNPIGSIIPFADSFTNPATINLQVKGGSQIQIWNVASQSYNGPYSYSGPQKSWQLSGVNTNLAINVGQGFFISPSSVTNWVQTSP